PRAFGKLGEVYVGATPGLQRYPVDAADAEAQGVLARVQLALREGAIATFDWREAARRTADSRTAFEQTAAMKRALARMLQGQRPTGRGLVDGVGRAAAKTTGRVLGLADIESRSSVSAPPARPASSHAPPIAAPAVLVNAPGQAGRP